jgi:tripartite-type tricarboxylate transporter receptor subunit TctC
MTGGMRHGVMDRVRVGMAAALIAIFAVMADRAVAQGYPTRPIRLVVAFAPGGTTDFVARLIANKVSVILGQNVIVDNKPGGNGMIAAESVARAEPDGYNLFFTTVGAMAINPTLRSHLSYDPIKDFAPVAMLVRNTILLAVNSKTKTKDLRDLVAMAREKPGGVTVGVTGVGAMTYLALELFQSTAGVKFQMVPYRGAAQALTDLLSGQIDAMFGDVPVLLAQIKAGTIRALGATSPQRSAILPDVATFIEQGLPTIAENWSAVVAPAGTPDAIVGKLAVAFAAAVEDPAVRARMAQSGVSPSLLSAEELGRLIRNETERWGGIIRAHGIKIE